MSDINSPGLDLSSISAEDIEQFLLEKQTKDTCNACEEQELKMLFSPTSTASLLLNPNSEDSPDRRSSVPLVVLVCQNCGGIHLHALGAVAMWKKSLSV